MRRIVINAKIKPLPFRIDKRVMVNFSDQVVEGVRLAIASGYYRAGEILPSQPEIAKAFDVSIRVPREAFRKLEELNIAASRRGKGCVVLARSANVWNGRVLFLMAAEMEGTYYASKMVGAMRRQLTAEGWMFSQFTLDRNRRGGFNLDPLKVALEGRYDLVVLFCHDDRRVLEVIAKSGIPHCSDSDFVSKSGSCGIVALDGADEAFLRQCTGSRVRKVLLAEYGPYEGLAEALTANGLAVEPLVVPPYNSEGYLEDIERGAYKAFHERFAPGRDFPDLVLCTEDYVARGALQALAVRGMKIPEDVRFVTWANKGHAPIGPVSLARFEFDPRASGERFSDLVLAHLEGRGHSVFPPSPVVYVKGESFPD